MDIKKELKKIEKHIQRIYDNSNVYGLNEYQKIAIKHLEAKYNKLLIKI